MSVVSSMSKEPHGPHPMLESRFAALEALYRQLESVNGIIAGGRQLLERCAAAGCTAVIVKPIAISDQLRRAKEWLPV